MLYDKLKNYSQSGIYPFHMPGHKRCDITGDNIIPYEIDLTEIYDFDNLHNPNGIIEDVQNKAKRLYSVNSAFILVNGATGGILAAVRAITNYGDRVLIARNCHKSVYNAAELCGLDVSYILPDIIPDFNIMSSITPKSVERELSLHSDIKAVIITSPTYEGAVSDIKSIADICHKYGAMLFVDEAHGAHFPFSEYFPNEAVSLGADVAVVSLHKTLPSLTQTALLLTNNTLLSNKIAENLSVFETSSPSYVLMSSVDKCLYYVSQEVFFEEYTRNLDSFYDSCANLKHLKLMTGNDFFAYDKSKIIISTLDTELNGVKLAEILRNNFKIEVEMAYSDYIIAMTSVCDTKEGFELLKNSLISIDKNCSSKHCPKVVPYSSFVPQKAFKSSEKHLYQSNIMNLNSAVNRISLEYVWAYPPGIPIIVPGEVISEEIIEQIKYLIQNSVEIYSTNQKMPDYIAVTEN